MLELNIDIVEYQLSWVEFIISRPFFGFLKFQKRRNLANKRSFDLTVLTDDQVSSSRSSRPPKRTTALANIEQNTSNLKQTWHVVHRRADITCLKTTKYFSFMDSNVKLNCDSLLLSLTCHSSQDKTVTIKCAFDY